MPLRHRLCNPPSVFVGRQLELRRLGEALIRGPVTVVSGPGGMGKTSLVQAALAAERPSRVDRTLAFSVSTGDRSGEQLGEELIAALSLLLTGSKPRGGATADPTSFFTMAIDLADALGAVVVVDDLHLIEGPLLRDLFEAALSYARASCWIATTRSETSIEGLEGQLIRLGPMATSELRSLLGAWSPSLDDDRASALVAEVNGSPYWLKHRLSTPRGAASSDDVDSVLGDLSEDVRTGLISLARIDTVVSEERLPIIHDGFDGPTIQRLVQRGMFERVPEGVRLHGVPRSLLIEVGPALDPVLAEKLRKSADPSLWVESIRLDMAEARLDLAVGTADRHAEEIIAAGLGPQLWQVLEDLNDERVVRSKLRCALDLGGGRAARWAAELPPPEDPAKRLLWLEVVALTSSFRRVADEARDFADKHSEHRPKLAARALLIGARALTSLVEPDAVLEAMEAVRSLPHEDDAITACATAWEARARAFKGESKTAIALVASLEPRIDTFRGPVREELTEQCAGVCFNLGRTRRAYELFKRSTLDGQVSPEQLGVRARLVRGSLFALELGDLPLARRLLDELAPVARRADELFAFYSMNELRYAAAQGDLDVAEEHMAGLLHATSNAQSAYWLKWLKSPRHYIDLLKGQPVDERMGSTPEDFPFTRAIGAWHEARANGTSTRMEGQPATDVADADIVLQLAESTIAALAGDGVRAAAKARSALALAEEEGLLLWQADSLVVLCEVLVLAGRDVSATAERLERLAASLVGSRYEDEAVLFRELARGAGLDVAVLDRLAAKRGDYPALRRARLALGFECASDYVDRALVARIRGFVAKPVVVGDKGSNPSATNRPALGLDTQHALLFLPSGATISLAKKPVAMNIMRVLIEGGGSATKETLVNEVWKVDSYHPLRDDKRLQVAIRRLRLLLDDETLVETTEHGYRIAPSIHAYCL